MYHAAAPLGHFMSNPRAEESRRWALCVHACVWVWAWWGRVYCTRGDFKRCPGAHLISFSFFTYFLSYSLLFLSGVPPPTPLQPCPTQKTSLCGMHDIQLNNNHKKKRVWEFRAPVVSMEGQLQTWISLQIKESLWGPNPVRPSLGRPYKGSTLNPLRVQLNEITLAMCDTLWFFISSSVSLHL